MPPFFFWKGKMNSMWIIFGGTEESPVVKRMVHKKSDLEFIRLEEGEWVEEFEVNGSNNDRKIRTPTNNGSMV